MERVPVPPGSVWAHSAGWGRHPAAAGGTAEGLGLGVGLGLGLDLGLLLLPGPGPWSGPVTAAWAWACCCYPGLPLLPDWSCRALSYTKLSWAVFQAELWNLEMQVCIDIPLILKKPE